MSYTEINNILGIESSFELLGPDNMDWAKPQYTKNEVNSAGSCLLHLTNEEELEHAIDVVNNFRSAHGFPLNTLQTFLRTHANTLNTRNITAQRLKRLSSILAKLKRFEKMELWDMQDIGGCRAVVRNLDEVQQIVDTYKSSRIRHKLSHEDDYIMQPRDSGYRSRHLVYRYYSEGNDVYNGRKIEIQIRTPIQHAWATTVETVDAFTKQALKSSRGERDWERFFQLMGTEMAFSEGTTLVPNTPTDEKELSKELKHCANELNVMVRLRGFTTALKGTEDDIIRRSAGYYLLSLDNFKERLSIRSYGHRELFRATEDYAKKEKEIRLKADNDAVLVSVKSIGDLRRAYPNYFADTSVFIKELEKALRK